GGGPRARAASPARGSAVSFQNSGGRYPPLPPPTTSAIAPAVAIGPHSEPSVCSNTPLCAPSASMSRTWSAASGGPSVSTVTVPPIRSVIWTASSTAHSSCGLTVKPDMVTSTSSPSGVTAIAPPTIGTRFTQTQISTPSAPDPVVGRVEQRCRPGHGDRDRVLLAEVLDRELGALDRLLGG